MSDDPVICPRGSVTPDDTVVFTARGPRQTEEGVLVSDAAGTVRAYVNRCPHLIDVRLDRGEGARIRDGELLCQRHGASFEPESGRCTYGPPVGAVLDPIDISVEAGRIVLTDRRFETVEPGLDPHRDTAAAGDREI
ncbi:MAG: Rieske 2Fe-2S domain-containing protein [Haloquadratum sp.]|jgi:nitrite reductase/ring-hydroxylating ferredoxin subunit|nr:Rieske 2Fe-2S domain-containing protein [Haloferacaceae archaeon]MDR9444577.1 Rieske 2Fe-2S domain-containing protein [Haloquadratum sp.]